MIIDNLASLPSTITTGDELPVERGTTTYKIDYNALAAAILARLGAGSDNIVDVANGGTGANTRLGAQHELMAYGATASVNDNPATYGAGIYHLGSSAFDTSYWPAASLWGVMIKVLGATLFISPSWQYVTPLRKSSILRHVGGSRSSVLRTTVHPSMR